MIEKNTILIDAVFINNGGGKILLDYLFEEFCADTSCNYTFLIDDRLKTEYQKKNSNNCEIIYIENFSGRISFYKKNKIKFKSVLCFGNIPPNVRLNTKVYTYFHQPMYLNIPKEFSLIEKITFQIKIQILKLYSKNTDFWLVQNDFIRDSLVVKYKLHPEKVLLMPFYPPLTGSGVMERMKNSFIFVSNANPHKNHLNLINAFCDFYDKYKEGILTITVNESFPEILSLIDLKKNQGYPINNIGFVSRDDLYKEYRSHQYLIFPSLAESFGLGLVEGIENGCKVIGADMPYTYQACEPSIIIETPQNKQNILDAMIKGIDYEAVPFSKQKIHNEIEKIIQLLKN